MTNKTKEQLIDELVELCQKVAELEKLENKRKRAKEELKKFKTITDKTGYGAAISDVKDNIVYINKSFANMHGYKQKELIGKKLSIFYTKEHIENVERLKEQLKQTGSYVAEEVWHKRKDGTIFPALMNGTVIKDDKGEPLYLSATVIDISDRKRAEEALRKSEKRFKELANLLPQIVFETDERGNFTFVNSGVFEVGDYGYAEEDFAKGMNVLQLLVPQDRDRAAEDIMRRFGGEELGPTEYTATRKDGSTFSILMYANPIFRKNIPVGLRGIVVDITEQKREEEEREKFHAQLIQSAKMAGIGTLASGIAHEFNNLLQIISGHVQFAQKTKKIENVEKAFDIILLTTDRAKKIIKDLSVFSRQEALKKELCDIKEPIELVLSLTEGQLKKNNIKVTRKYEQIPKLKVNTGELQQVFLNLITNARDAMLPEGGKLRISVKQVEESVKVSFHDTGKGIRKEDIDKLFEPFYTTKEAVGGRNNMLGPGLGLSVSYGIVLRHGGTIEVESTIGKGSTFTVKFPVSGVVPNERKG